MELEANAPTLENTENAAPEANGQEAQAPTVADIDSFSEFKFQGQAYTPEKLAKIFQEHSTHSEKVKQYSEYDNYIANLAVDLETVLHDPNLADQFKQTYPKQFHSVLDRLLKQEGRQDASQEANTSQMPKEVLSKIQMLEGKLSKYERMAHEAEVAKQEAYLQKTVDPLFTKYDFANPDAVYAKAEALISQGYQMTDAAWERLIKENHQAIQKKVEANHQAKLKTQLEKGQQGKDIGQGGTAPGQAPRRAARTFDEATEEMLKSMNGR